jgi:hypothetical protein
MKMENTKFRIAMFSVTSSLAALAALCGIAPAQQSTAAQNPAGQNLNLPELPNPYRMTADFITMPDGRRLGSTNAINVDAKGNIWVFERCGANSCTGSNVDPILEFDPSGQHVIRSFGAG